MFESVRSMDLKGKLIVAFLSVAAVGSGAMAMGGASRLHEAMAQRTEFVCTASETDPPVKPGTPCP